MNDEKNRKVWSLHYNTEKSRQTIPDENIVRFYQRYLRETPEITNPYVLEVACGSGRNLSYLQNENNHVYGMDFAANILKNQHHVVCADSRQVPFKDHIFDIVIAWGLLHYLSPESLHKTLQEIRRVMKKSAVFWGTIRSDQDTHLQAVISTGDLQDGSATLYTRKDLSKLFSDFSEVKLGMILRQNPGDDKIIAHHTFELRP